MSLLIEYGWNSSYSNNDQSRDNNLQTARVISIKGFKYILVTLQGELEAELSGKLLHLSEGEELPKVGDWVTYVDYETMGYIVDVLPRKNLLSRKNPGAKVERQILATNIDMAIIVQGLDRDFNIMRLERYLVQMAACGIPSMVVLNKSDLVPDVNPYIAQVNSLQRDVPVICCSAHKKIGINEIRETILLPGKTYIMLGSSGVGKSSLMNELLEQSIQATGILSDSNQKGRHTTTARELFKLPNGVLMIDTPGMREFGLTHEDSVSDEQLFPAISELARSCRFADCTHFTEQGCAVLQALQSGSLESSIYDSYIKLIKEQRRFQITADEKKRMGKQFGKIVKEAKAHRKRYKY